MWLNTSNLSPRDGFLLALHEQLVDLQDYVYRNRMVSRESRYYSVVYEYPGVQTPLNDLLNHIFHHRMVLQHNFIVWRTNVPMEPENPTVFRAYIQLNHPVSEVTVSRFLHTESANVFHLKWIHPLDSYEFIHAISQWIPLNEHIRAWCRFVHPVESDFSLYSPTLPFTESPHYIESEDYQQKLREMWSIPILNQMLEINYD